MCELSLVVDRPDLAGPLARWLHELGYEPFVRLTDRCVVFEMASHVPEIIVAKFYLHKDTLAAGKGGA